MVFYIRCLGIMGHMTRARRGHGGGGCYGYQTNKGGSTFIFRKRSLLSGGCRVLYCHLFTRSLGGCYFTGGLFYKIWDFFLVLFVTTWAVNRVTVIWVTLKVWGIGDRDSTPFAFLVVVGVDRWEGRWDGVGDIVGVGFIVGILHEVCIVGTTPGGRVVRVGVTLGPEYATRRESRDVPPGETVDTTIHSSSPVPVVVRANDDGGRLTPPVSVRDPLIF